jgi:hypothetical protein
MSFLLPSRCISRQKSRVKRREEKLLLLLLFIEERMRRRGGNKCSVQYQLH